MRLDDMLEVNSLRDFSKASRSVLAILKQRTGLDTWMTTRVSGPDQIVLNLIDDAFGVCRGDVLSWSGSFCRQMVEGNGPCVALDISTEPAYASAPNGKSFPFSAYVGAPIKLEDGELFGTVCAYDSRVQPEALKDELPLISLLANLLGVLASYELRLLEVERDNEQLKKESERDELTGLLNRKGWNHRSSKEASRGRRYGQPMAVYILDLDDLKQVNDLEGHQAGDALLQQAAEVLTSTMREHDIVSRLGGDEFAVLALRTNESAARDVFDKLMSAFAQANINISIGYNCHHLGRDLEESVVAADKAMYSMKSQHKKGNVAC